MADFLYETPERQLNNYRAISIGLAIFAFCIGGAALMGWVFDVEVLKRIHPQLVTMKANTAVCLMLASVSVFLLQENAASTTKRRIGLLLAAIIAVVGAITVSEHVFGWNSGLDQLLFHESVAEAGESFPGRMVVAASLNFDYKNKLWGYNSGVSREHMELSPGWVLLAHTIQWCCDHGRYEFDFMRGDEEYKYRFGGMNKHVMRAKALKH